ncbi:MAG TPA: DUF3578 domain-containing protein [Longimicrobiaceae bacterium]|nr:DUF3578 domain-containing protein [Longimicrobiaceae bacterium]
METGGPLREKLEEVLARYADARAGEPFGEEHPLWGVFKALRQALSAHPAVRATPTLRVSWSAGFGTWAKVPWVAMLDTRETTSVREGVYCALLFRQDTSGVYLALCQGAAEPRKQVGREIARTVLRARALELRALCDPLPELGFALDDRMDLRAEAAPVGDPAATVAHKLYEAGSVPPDEILSRDLEALLAAYRRCVEEKEERTAALPADAYAAEPDRWERPWDRAEATAALAGYVGRRGFVFEPWQVAAYATALRTKPFAILAGVAGTGKSRLPALVAEGTGGVARLVPVRPDWTDSAEVLGYTDLRGEFRPGIVLDAAREAMGQPRRHWVSVLDEMNLARVEQYFAEVLSRMEDRRPHPRGGFATAPLLHPTLHPGDAWSGVVLPPNLALVGTVNVDESAHGFSRKVLDRAFTLELAEPDLSAWEPVGTPGDAEPAWWPVAAWHPRAVTLAGLGALSDCERARVRETVEALASANASLVPAGLQVGYRTRDEAALFVLHAAETPDAFATRGGAAVDPLDLALGMKLLPRIAGGSDAVRRALLGLLGWARGGRALDESEARALLEEWERAGRPAALPGARFPRTAARLALMWERFLAEGFTSFWL